MMEPHIDKVLRAYKKRAKAIQRRIQIEKDVNKRLMMLLEQATKNPISDLLRKQIEHELECSKYKYY